MMLRLIYKLATLTGLLLVLFVSVAAAQYQNGIPVLLYHHVSEDDSDMPELNVMPVEFDRQMRMLRQSGFETVLLDDLLAYMRGERVKLPEKPIVITFDDGYTDNYTNAFPILKKYDYKAAIFMVGINFDRKNRLSSQQIREMAGSTFTVGAHSMTHPDLTALAERSLEAEVKGSKQKAERVTHKEAKYFAYPGGFYTLASVEAVEAAGYQGAFTVLSGLNKPGKDNVYLLRRIPVFASTDFDRLLVLLNENRPKTSLLDY